MSVVVRIDCTKAKDNTQIIQKYYCNSKMIHNKVKMDTKLGKLSKSSKNQYSKVDVALFNTSK